MMTTCAVVAVIVSSVLVVGACMRSSQLSRADEAKERKVADAVIALAAQQEGTSPNACVPKRLRQSGGA